MHRLDLPKNLYALFMAPPANRSRILMTICAIGIAEPIPSRARRCGRVWSGVECDWVAACRRRFGTDWLRSQQRRNRLREPATVGGRAMLDFLMVAYGVGFFAAAIFYVLACEKM
jgi:hypothetical protein